VGGRGGRGWEGCCCSTLPMWILLREEQLYVKVLKISFNSNLLSSVLCMSGLSPLEGFLFVFCSLCRKYMNFRNFLEDSFVYNVSIHALCLKAVLLPL
jgi:hypothetical protein